jgi:hypothetical protein
LPTAGLARKKDKITLPKAVPKKKNRGSILSVQKAGRAFERAKKRVATQQACEDGAREGEPGDQVGVRAPEYVKVAIGAPSRSGRYI